MVTVNGRQYNTLEEAAMANETTTADVRRMCNKGAIEGAFISNHKWYIPVEWGKKRRVFQQTEGFVTSNEASVRFGISPELVRQYCRDGKINGAVQLNGIWHIPQDWVYKNRYESKDEWEQKLSDSGYSTMERVSTMFNVSRTKLAEMCRDGEIPNAQKTEEGWIIPSRWKYTKKEPTEKKNPEGYWFVHQVSLMCGIHEDTLTKLCRNGRIDGAKKIDRVWVIPESWNPAEYKTDLRMCYERIQQSEEEEEEEEEEDKVVPFVEEKPRMSHELRELFRDRITVTRKRVEDRMWEKIRIKHGLEKVYHEW